MRESTSIASSDTTAPFRASAAGRLAVRCETACYRSLRLCRQKDVARERAWLACQELNRYRGFPVLSLQPGPLRRKSQILRVLFTIRKKSGHQRDLQNIPELVANCERFEHHGWRATCNSAAFAQLSTEEGIRLVRNTDVLVCMNGGDCVHGFHLPAGRTLLETVNAGFENAAYFWLNEFKRRLEPVVIHRRVILSGPPLSAHHVEALDLSAPSEPSSEPLLERSCRRGTVTPTSPCPFFSRCSAMSWREVTARSSTMRQHLQTRRRIIERARADDRPITHPRGNVAWGGDKVENAEGLTNFSSERKNERILQHKGGFFSSES